MAPVVRLTLYLFLCSSLLLLPNLPNAFGDDELHKYVIIVRHSAFTNVSSHEERVQLYTSLLSQSIAGSSNDLPASKRLIYSYAEVVNGFAARLTEKELEEMKKYEWFAYAIHSRDCHLHTTSSPRFLGLSGIGGVWNHSNINMGEGMIIGVMDSGLKPTHPSFNDAGLPNPPPKWRGRCDFEKCNNKLIGGQAFTQGSSNARDIPEDRTGHGTHVASTAAGSFVEDASYYEMNKGVASGMAPRAHLAMYKACYDRCVDIDIMAAAEAAIKDGVDVLSVSMGMHAEALYMDTLAIATFHAINSGVVACCSAGNDGPTPASLKNEAPWILTVAASTTDVRFASTIKLGNGLEIESQSIYQPSNFDPKMMPLVNARDYGMINCGTRNTTLFNATGKIVICDLGGKDGGALIDSGAAAVIIVNYKNYGYSLRADPTDNLPTANVAYGDGVKIMAYINSTLKPTALLTYKGTVSPARYSPSISPFSSRGPSILTPGIIKPDITAPGENILAASYRMLMTSWDYSTSVFTVMSGTSMSTPHVCGLAALIRKAHPEWSPAAVKSAIMTTADATYANGRPIVDETRRPASHFAMGAGHVNPRKALDPGLVYDLAPKDYVPYLCSLGYDDDQVSAIIFPRPQAQCSTMKKITASELNYPSIWVFLQANSNKTVTVPRVVTNVGKAQSAYRLEIGSPAGVAVSVLPRKLIFTDAYEKKAFNISFKTINNGGGGRGCRNKTVDGYLKWVSKHYAVRSPISVTLYC